MKQFNPFDESIAYPGENELKCPAGMVKILSHDGRKDILPFLHDVTLASLDGTVYEAWYNSTSAEICGSSLIRGRFSPDGGLNWSDPFCVVGEMSEAEEHFVPADLFAHNGRLYALITTMSGKNMTVDLQLFRKREDPMEKWEFLGRVAPGILCNTPPQKMDNGNYIVGGWMPMKQQDPAFPMALISDGDDIEKPWRPVLLFDPLSPKAVSIRCPETTVIVKGSHVDLFIRNDEGPSYIIQSEDYGEHWGELMENAMPIGNSKIFAGRLSDGRAYLVYNQDRGYFIRTLLVIAVETPATGKFDRVYKLFEGHDEDLDRGRIWFYPSACEQDGFLYVGVTLQETSDIRSTVIAKIPVESL